MADCCKLIVKKIALLYGAMLVALFGQVCNVHH